MFRNTANDVRSFHLTGEVGLPLHGQELFFQVVAFLTAGNNITFGGFSAPGDGYDVIHGQFFGQDRATAVITGAFVTFSFPPLGAAHFARLVTFFIYIVF